MTRHSGSGRPSDLAAQQMDSAAAGLNALFKANADAAQLWLDTWRGAAVELGNFATKRWTRDMDMARRMCSCQTPVDLLGLQAEFVNQAMKEYMDEAAKLMTPDMSGNGAARRRMKGGATAMETPA